MERHLYLVPTPEPTPSFEMSFEQPHQTGYDDGNGMVCSNPNVETLSPSTYAPSLTAPLSTVRALRLVKAQELPGETSDIAARLLDQSPWG